MSSHFLGIIKNALALSDELCSLQLFNFVSAKAGDFCNGSCFHSFSFHSVRKFKLHLQATGGFTFSTSLLKPLFLFLSLLQPQSMTFLPCLGHARVVLQPIFKPRFHSLIFYFVLRKFSIYILCHGYPFLS